MSYYRRTPFVATFYISYHPLDLIQSFIDLEVTMDTKLSFTVYISNIANKAMSILGFIKRCAKEFNDHYITKLLFTSLVRPILEFGSCVWCPYYNTHINRLESV